MNKIIIAIAVLLAAVSVQAKVVSGKATGLAWTAPTQNQGGSPLTDLAGYKVYKDDVEIADVTTESYEWLSFPLEHGAVGVFYVTAYDEAGNESAPSDTLTLTADLVGPAAPVNFSVTILVNSN